MTGVRYTSIVYVPYRFAACAVSHLSAFDEIQHEHRAHAVVRESLPHLGDEQQAEAARMSEERAVVEDRRTVRSGRGDSSIVWQTWLVDGWKVASPVAADYAVAADHGQIARRRLRAAGRLLHAPLYTRGRLFDARRPVARRLLLERRNDLGARGVLRGMLAARMEDAARRRIRRRRDVAGEHDARFLRRWDRRPARPRAAPACTA